MSKFVPLNAYVQLRPKPITESKGGILLPEDTHSTTRHGEVVSIATTVLGDKSSNFIWVSFTVPFVVGSTVLYPSGYGRTTIIDGEEFVIIKADEILGIFTEAN